MHMIQSGEAAFNIETDAEAGVTEAEFKTK
jgi:hypothetical protein